MKKLYTVILICFALSAQADYWTQKAAFSGTVRNYPFSFSIGNKGYMGGGINYDLGSVLLVDFWEYDQATNAWTQKADYAGSGSHGGIGFSVLNKGYAGTGYGAGFAATDEMFEYDPVLNTWSPIAVFGGGARVGVAGFNTGNKGYAGTGYPAPGDLWEYDPVADTWTQKSNFATSRNDAISFSINNKGYLGCGYNQPNILFDFWEYDPATDVWTQKADFPGTPVCDAASFSIGNKGYIGVGEGPVIGSDLTDFWQYDPAANLWTQKATFPGIARDEPVYFSIGSKGYIGLGYHYGISYFNDFWEYTPDSTTGIADFGLEIPDFSIYPNPAKDFIVISYSPDSHRDGKEKISLTVTDASGKKVYAVQSEISNPKSEIKIDLIQFSNGIYFVEVTNDKDRMVKKFVKE